MANILIVTKSGSVFKTYTNIVHRKFVIICEQSDHDEQIQTSECKDLLWSVNLIINDDGADVDYGNRDNNNDVDNDDCVYSILFDF